MVKEDKVFNYLDRLRDSGITNMLGATPYIEQEFGLSEKDARKLLVKWIESFGKRNKNK